MPMGNDSLFEMAKKRMVCQIEAARGMGTGSENDGMRVGESQMIVLCAYTCFPWHLDDCH